MVLTPKLEKDYRNYQKKRLLVKFLGLVVVVVIAVAVYFILGNNESTNVVEVVEEKIEKVVVQETPKEQVQQVVEKAVIASPIEQEEPIQKVETPAKVENVVEEIVEIKEPVEAKKEKMIIEFKADLSFAEKLEKKVTPIATPVLKKKVGVESLMNAYNSDKTYDNAVKVGEYYFANEEYNNAIKWALTANKININDERSWSIYIKSLAAQGKTNKAVRIGNSYLKLNDSENIKKLLKNIGQ